MSVNVDQLKSMSPPTGMDFHIANVGHVVLQVSDLERATEFYTRVLGFVDQVGSDGRVRPASEWHGVRSLEEAIANPVPGQDTHLPR